ncbi:MAG: MerR family transcriptional regulator [Eubacteriales bacterium]|nr:MerR family transcriptional regulator [Eubacteriales bacterium]
MKINEVAKLTGVTVRTLHYYDEIGLLKPSQVTEAGYRLYNDAALSRLQQILFFRELDFELTEIREIMDSPAYDAAEALQKQKTLLEQRRARLDGLIELTDRVLKGENTMEFKQFDTSAIEAAKDQYKAEVKQRWGNTEAYRQSEQKNTNWEAFNRDSAAIFKKFAANMDKDPGDPAVQALVAQWQQFITDRMYTCTKEILKGLGQMYTADERFTKNIDQSREGTAAFMSEAIRIYCA